MLLDQTNWELGYRQMVSDCRGSSSSFNTSGGTVLILVNPDADALCAARILSYALRADKVPYQLRPCGGYNCLLRILDKLALNNDDEDVGTNAVCAVVLLNLGATRNLQKALFEPIYNEQGDIVRNSLLDADKTKVYILDSHRPYHLANIYAQKNITVWNDFDFWHEDEGGIPSDGEYLDDESDSDSDDEDDSDDDDSDDDGNASDSSEGEAEFDDASNDVEGGKRASSESPSVSSKRARTDPDTPEIQASDNEDDDEKDEKKEEDSTPVLSMREKHQIRRDKVRKYYGNGAFYSSPVAYMAYLLLSEQLRHNSVGDLLWLACVGVTDAFIHDRLDLSGYANIAMNLQEKVEKVYPDLQNDDRFLEDRNFVAEELFDDTNSGPRTKVGFSENGKILYQRNEYRFFLLRHSSLWDAMVLSPDMNTKMQIWRNSGVKDLQEMLAKMGLPLQQCQQPYAFMKPALKRRLKTMMAEHEEVSTASNVFLTLLAYTFFLINVLSLGI